MAAPDEKDSKAMYLFAFFHFTISISAYYISIPRTVFDFFLLQLKKNYQYMAAIVSLGQKETISLTNAQHQSLCRIVSQRILLYWRGVMYTIPISCLICAKS